MEEQKNNYQVFISYSSKEKETADLVKENLENNGISCWMAPESIPAGSGYASEITEAISTCKAVVLILSAPAMASVWVTKEVDFALQNQCTIIPFHIDDADLNSTFKLYLNNVQRIEAYRRVRMALSDLNDRVCAVVTPANSATIRIHLKPCYQEPVFQMVGREKEINEIAEHLENHNIVALSGIGGIGKTELAKEYVKRAYKANRYGIVCFCHYLGSLQETIAHLEFSNFDERSFIDQIKNNENASSITKELYKRKLALLESEKASTILIIDGFDNLEDPDINVLNRLSCHIILSTRCHFKQYATVNIEAIQDMEEKVRLFYRYYEDGSPSDAYYKAIIENIINTVGGHTLTIKLVAQFLQTTGYDPQDILTALQKNALNGVFKSDQIEHNQKYETINDHLTSLFVLSEMAPADELILAHLALMPNQGVRKYLFREWSNDQTTMTNVQKLVDRGWVNSSQGYLSLHPLIQAVINNKIQPNTVLCHEFLTNIMNALVVDKIPTLSQLQEMSAIAQSLLAKLNDKNEFMVQLLTKIGQYENGFLYYQLFALKEKQDFNFSFAQVVTSNIDRLKDFQKAHQILQRALALTSMIAVSPLTQGVLYSVLASSIFNAGNYQQALAYNQKTLEYYEQVYEQRDEHIFTTIRRMGTCAYYAKDYQKAYEYYNQNLQERSEMMKVQTIDLTDFARSNMYVANALSKLDKYDEAWNYYNIALEYANKDEKNILGIAEMHIQIGDLLERKNDVLGAKEHYLQALNIYQTYTANEARINEINQMLL